MQNASRSNQHTSFNDGSDGCNGSSRSACATTCSEPVTQTTAGPALRAACTSLQAASTAAITDACTPSPCCCLIPLMLKSAGAGAAHTCIFSREHATT